MRANLRKRYLDKLTRRTRTWTADQLTAPAIVIAPHQDEQTLGCGATIAAKKAAGAAVHVVFMTDDCQRNGHLMRRQDLLNLRRQEALAAGRVLGLDPREIHFLDFPDGSLIQHRQAAAAALREILTRFPPRQAFVPFRGDSTNDHLAASQIFYDAAEACEHGLDVFEYPVWFWSRWPWSPGPGRRSWKKMLAHTRDAARASWAIRFQLRAYAASPEAVDAKRRALAEHRSQTVRHESNPAWVTLGDMGDGHFLQHFMGGFEVFHRKTI